MPSRLRREIRQDRPFVNRAEEAFLNLQRTAHVLGQRLGQFLRSFRLSPPQYNALRILRGAHPSPLPCKEVATRMVTPMPDVTRLLDRLEDRGLVSRCRSTGDRRIVEATISGLGLELLARIDAPLADWMEEALGGLGDRELDALIGLLERGRSGPEDRS